MIFFISFTQAYFWIWIGLFSTSTSFISNSPESGEHACHVPCLHVQLVVVVCQLEHPELAVLELLPRLQDVRQPPESWHLKKAQFEMEICVIFVILDLVWYQLILSILPDVNKSVSLLVLELLDACNHFVVKTVSICSPKKINMVNSCTSIQHTESLIWSSEKTKLQKYFTIALRIGISGITHHIQCEGEDSTCTQRLSSSQELEQDPCLLVTAKK